MLLLRSHGAIGQSELLWCNSNMLNRTNGEPLKVFTLPEGICLAGTRWKSFSNFALLVTLDYTYSRGLKLTLSVDWRVKYGLCADLYCMEGGKEMTTRNSSCSNSNCALKIVSEHVHSDPEKGKWGSLQAFLIRESACVSSHVLMCKRECVQSRCIYRILF